MITDWYAEQLIAKIKGLERKVQCCCNPSGGTSLGYWTQNGNNLYPTTLSNTVGIGTSSPIGQFQVNGQSFLSYTPESGMLAGISFNNASTIYPPALPFNGKLVTYLLDTTVSPNVVGYIALDDESIHGNSPAHLNLGQGALDGSFLLEIETINDSSYSNPQWAINATYGANASSLITSPTECSFSVNNVSTINIDASGTIINPGGLIDASAQLQVDSTTQGFLPPRMTTAEKNAITSPAEGLMVYDLTLHAPFYFNGSIWVAF